MTELQHTLFSANMLEKCAQGKVQILVIVKNLRPTYTYNNMSSQPPCQVGLTQACPNNDSCPLGQPVATKCLMGLT